MKVYRVTAFILLIITAAMAFNACSKYPADTAPETTKGSIMTETQIPETTAQPETTSQPVLYYVKVEWLDGEKAFRGEQTSLDDAIAIANRLAVQGYRVFDGNGNTVYLPYTQLQCDILREAKRVTDYCRENKFKYGDAPTNPAINNKAKKVSCDRLVCWVMYNVGFTDQPKVQGVVVSVMADWCEKQGFEKITSMRKMEPGDIVLVNPNGAGVAGHTFIYAGTTDDKAIYYRYDCGSNERIQAVQPFEEGISNFICAYRPKAG